jgi:hypothetical protein
MTPEEMRSDILRGIDAILEAPWIISRLLSAEHRRLLRAQRTYWSQDDGAQLQRLIDVHAREPVRAEDDDAPEGK